MHLFIYFYCRDPFGIFIITFSMDVYSFGEDSSYDYPAKDTPHTSNKDKQIVAD